MFTHDVTKHYLLFLGLSNFNEPMETSGGEQYTMNRYFIIGMMLDVCTKGLNKHLLHALSKIHPKMHWSIRMRSSC